MDKIRAFVGHSFNDEDLNLVRTFTDYFDSLKNTSDFEWDHAEKAEAMALSEKVKKKMDRKNLFIGILTRKGLKLTQEDLKWSKIWKKSYLKSEELQSTASEWIIQESGYGLAKCGRILFLVEEGVDFSAGLQGDTEFIPFERDKPELCFRKINEMIGSLLSIENKDITVEETTMQPLKSISEKGIEEEQISSEKSEQNDPFLDRMKLYSLIISKRDFAEAEIELDSVCPEMG